MVNKCKECCTLSLRDFGLSSTNFEDLTRDQWALHWIVLLIYRIVVTGYFFGYELYLWIKVLDIKFYIYMTDWTYTVFVIYHVLALTNLVADIILKRYLVTREATSVFRVRYMVQWLLYNVVQTWTMLVLVVFWGALFNPAYVDWLFDLTCHLFPGVFSLIELGLVATPCRVAQVVYPATYGIIYLTFTLIYWATGHPPIYPILDYSGNPGVAAGSIAGMAAFIFIYHMLIVWGLTKLRVRVARRFNRFPRNSERRTDILQTELIDIVL
ncbi:protein rolling stone-like [Diadema antillarum]|uniref:protein rolling stone-like n=1 Tax=Diadema antillarum TaxID=105358 RepID=UPI003A8A44A5